MSTEPRFLIRLHRTVALAIVAFLVCSETVTLAALNMEFQGHQHLRKAISAGLQSFTLRFDGSGKVQDPISHFAKKFDQFKLQTNENLFHSGSFKKWFRSIYDFFTSQKSSNKVGETPLDKAYDVLFAILSNRLQLTDLVNQIKKAPKKSMVVDSQTRRIIDKWLSEAGILKDIPESQKTTVNSNEVHDVAKKYEDAVNDLRRSGSPAADRMGQLTCV
ncbi:RxLR-like protein [Plasmopara halstedii]|uniref:RxLR-like protein n=1 Tax=Plasmopara halstedii TaxID=4781 RepID=A0A0P1AKR8_PLAHL|nr:RxLR-like protein [Plasmopara halstedii]CEG41444.1 RxLR-like protein [Plasmopara halstedii]|eukprot:XP_024577813.1 RxLR-like protein [Plasmopara halstedii]